MVTLATSSCPDGLYANCGELMVTILPAASESVFTGALQPSFFINPFSFFATMVTGFVSVSVTVTEMDLNNAPLVFANLRSIHQVAHVPSFSKERPKAADGGGGGDTNNKGRRLPVTVAYSPQTQQNSAPWSGLRIYQYSPFGSRPTISAVSPTSNIPTRSNTAPGPVRQFVSTETVICGVDDVAVKSGTGEKVGSAVKVGVSGVTVNVAVGGLFKTSCV